MPILVEPARHLVAVADLSEFDGAPTSQQIVDAASEDIRGYCGWHIAPAFTETITVDSEGGPVLLLPTLRLTAVTEVRDMTSETPRVITGWRKSRNGMLSRPGGWPQGFAAIEVDLTHGYDQCPPELLPVVVDAARVNSRGGRVVQESLGSRSVSLLPDSPLARTLDRFKLPSRP